MWKAGPTNSLADIAGLRFGHAHDAQAKTGTSVVVFDTPTTASVSVVGQAPGTRETELLDPARTVGAIDALVLSGGSAFGLAAADAVMGELAKARRGFAVGDARVPIVPSAILFDLNNGGKKPADMGALYQSLGRLAEKNSRQENSRQENTSPGSIGAGFGATTGAGKGGLGMASSAFTEAAPKPLQGHTVAALVAINSIGSPYLGDGPHLRAAPFELDAEFGGLGLGHTTSSHPRTKLDTKPGQNTTIGCLITTAPLTKTGCYNLAIAGQDGVAAAIFPAHTALDGDLIFAASTTDTQPITDPAVMVMFQAAGMATMARAIARGVYSANLPMASQS
jgi:L-aminopeptidase/D-esterase-like protein